MEGQRVGREIIRWVVTFLLAVVVVRYVQKSNSELSGKVLYQRELIKQLRVEVRSDLHEIRQEIEDLDRGGVNVNQVQRSKEHEP
jgi:hypothetical protein